MYYGAHGVTSQGLASTTPPQATRAARLPRQVAKVQGIDGGLISLAILVHPDEKKIDLLGSIGKDFGPLGSKLRLRPKVRRIFDLRPQERIESSGGFTGPPNY